MEPIGSDLVMLGRWQRILIDALDESEAVGVQARAGHILADRGLAETVLVFGQRTNGGRQSRSLVLIRSGSAVVGDPNALLRAAVGQPVGRRLRESQRIRQARLIRGAVANADAAAISARTADMAVIDQREARQLADQLGTVIADFGRLRRRLDTRAKSGPERDQGTIRRSGPSDH